MASLQWARDLGPGVWQEEAFEEARRLRMPVCTVKVQWRGTLLDLTVPVAETSFAAQLLKVVWGKMEKVVQIGSTGENAIVAPLVFLHHIKESHVRCERSLDWSKHMRKLTRLSLQLPFDQRVYAVLDAIKEQHRTFYGLNREEIEVPRRNGLLTPRDIAGLAIEFGLSLQSFSCRCQDWLWRQIVQQFEKIEKEYVDLSTPRNTEEQVIISHLPTRLWPLVPSDVHGLIFKRMRAQDFRQMQTVCRAWMRYFDDEAVVRFIFQVQFGEPFTSMRLSKPIFVLEAREACGPLSSSSVIRSSPEAVLEKCLAMREALFVGHGLPRPQRVEGKYLEWVRFILQNVVIVAPPSCAQGKLGGRELHETPRNCKIHAWFPGCTCEASFHAGTEGSSQTSWEAIRLAIKLKSHDSLFLLGHVALICSLGSTRDMAKCPFLIDWNLKSDWWTVLKQSGDALTLL